MYKLYIYINVSIYVCEWIDVNMYTKFTFVHTFVRSYTYICMYACIVQILETKHWKWKWKLSSVCMYVYKKENTIYLLCICIGMCIHINK